MTSPVSVPANLGPAASRFTLFFYPDLATLPRDERAAALARARKGDFDALELFGLAFALILTTALTRYVLIDAGLAHRVAAALVNFAFAFALMAVLAGPFLLRRTRRGLRAYLDERRPRDGLASGVAP